MSEEFQHMMNEKIRASQKSLGRESLLGELEKKVLLANTPNNKPLLWSRIALKNAGLYSDYQEALSRIIDPSLIYMDEALSDKQVEECSHLLTQSRAGCCQARRTWARRTRRSRPSCTRCSWRWRRPSRPCSCTSRSTTRPGRSPGS